MIRNIVFDMGNVLIIFDPALFMTREGITDPEDRRIIMNELFLSLEWAQMDSSEVNTIIAAGFKRSWRARQELKQELMPLAGIPQMHLGEQEKREF